jgi:hypothetical protein
MSDIYLTQNEAEALIAIEKTCLDNNSYNYPQMGEKLQIPLFSLDSKERFMLDIFRARIDITKTTNHMRVRTNIPLVRLDLGKSLYHRNPDGVEIWGPHVHFYREGYELKYAWALPTNGLSESENLKISFEEFKTYCNIIKLPAIQWDIF